MEEVVTRKADKFLVSCWGKVCVRQANCRSRLGLKLSLRQLVRQILR